MNLDFRVEGRLNAYPAQVYATESSLDMETHSLNIRAIYPNRTESYCRDAMLIFS